MIGATVLALAQLLVSERPHSCTSPANCPSITELRAAVYAFDRARLEETQARWERDNKVIIGPDAFVLSKIEGVHCVNGADIKTATCKFDAIWGRSFRESFIADLHRENGHWQILGSSKSIVKKLK